MLETKVIGYATVGEIAAQEYSPMDSAHNAASANAVRRMSPDIGS
ncbi:MAG: hypothetical protein ACPGYP_08960 [Solirubrobacterales bacterium]